MLKKWQEPLLMPIAQLLIMRHKSTIVSDYAPKIATQYTAKWSVQNGAMIFQTLSRVCLKNACAGLDAPLCGRQGAILGA